MLNKQAALTGLILLGSVMPGADVVNLRCEYLTDPYGVDTERPHLGWVIRSERRGERQTAYQVLVASTEEALRQDRGDLWDSGKVGSADQNHLVYSGTALGSGARCHWKVRIWDRDGVASAWSRPAFWMMGRLKPEDWQAKWIGLDEAIPADAFDSEITEGKLVILKAIYSAADPSKAVDVTDILNRKIDKGTLWATIKPKALGVDPGNGPKHLAVTYQFNGESHTFETPTANTLGDIHLPAGTMHMDTPEGLQERRRWPIPRQFRKEFQTGKNLKHATLSVTALGLYEFRINGRRVGDHLLAPEWTDYHKRIQYQTFDVTDLITPGANAMGAMVGNGWYCGGWMFWGKLLKPVYGKDPCLLAQLELEYADGSRQLIATDASWRGTTAGPIRFAGIYEGEIYDARKEMPGWDSPGFDQGGWKEVAIRSESPQAKPLDFKPGKLAWQRSDPIRKARDIIPIAITEPKPGIFVADMGQIFSGWTRLTVRAPAGTRLTLQHAEVLNPDGTAYIDNLRAGHFGTGDRQMDRYFCRGGGEEVLEPHFTYHGFRYVEIHGLPRKPAAEEIAGVVFHTGFRKVGDFTCSNPSVNRLVENIQWSQRANTMGIPTDCNQRDERCGYTGDMNFFMPAAVYNFDVAPFFNKWLMDIDEAQMPGGWFPDHAPYYGPGGGPNVGWSDAGIICPWRMYREYGDTTVIREHYASMKRAMEHLTATTRPDGLRGDNAKPSGGDGAWRIGLGDHLKPGPGNKVSAEVVGTAYLAFDARIMAEMADAIQEHGDAAAFHALAGRTAQAFAGKLIDADGRVQGDSQTGYALAFDMGLVPEDRKAAVSARFHDLVIQAQGQVATGFMGNPHVLQALEQAGLADAAYQLLLSDRYPSWLYAVTKGATTMWEHFGSLAPDGSFSDPQMNSFSHYAHGAVGGFIFGHIGGIRPETPGYRRVLIKPVIRDGLDWAKTRYDSINGPIATSWKRDHGTILLDVTIPANVTATVHVPIMRTTGATGSSTTPVPADGTTFLRLEEGAAVYEVGSGDYQFRSGPQVLAP